MSPVRFAAQSKTFSDSNSRSVFVRENGFVILIAFQAHLIGGGQRGIGSGAQGLRLNLGETLFLLR